MRKWTSDDGVAPRYPVDDLPEELEKFHPSGMACNLIKQQLICQWNQSLSYHWNFKGLIFVLWRCVIFTCHNQQEFLDSWKVSSLTSVGSRTALPMGSWVHQGSPGTWGFSRPLPVTLAAVPFQAAQGSSMMTKNLPFPPCFPSLQLLPNQAVHELLIPVSPLKL